MLSFKEFLTEEDDDLLDKSVHGKTFFRGSHKNKEANPTGLYATSDHKQASGYAYDHKNPANSQITTHTVKPDAKILNIDHPKAVHKLYDNVRPDYKPDEKFRYGAFGALGSNFDGFGDHDGEIMRANLAKHGYHGASTSVDGNHRVFIFHGHHE